MTTFLILLIAFCITGVISRATKKQNAHEYYKKTTSNCKLQYQIGCDKYIEFINEYKKHEQIVFDWSETGRITDPFFGIKINVISGRDVDYTDYQTKSNLIISLFDMSKQPMDEWFGEWILSPNYRDGNFFDKLIANKNKRYIRNEIYPIYTIYGWNESEDGLTYYQMEKQKFEFIVSREIIPKIIPIIKYSALYLRSQEAIKKVAEHYELPTNDETNGTCYQHATNTDSLAGLIYDYSEREIRKMGYAPPRSTFSHFTSNPTDEDIYKAEECDTFTTSFRRQIAKTEKIEQKYPWIEHMDSKKKKK